MPSYPYRGKRPRVAADAWIAPTAVLVGDVTIESGASVWFGCVLRGDADRIVVGARTNVQDNSTIHADEGEPTLIGSDVTIGHMALVHSSVVGSNALIGQGAVLVGRNTIGDGALVAAGSVLTQGFAVPAGSVAMGIPAKVTREARDEDRRWTVTSAAHYVERAAEYRARLTGEVEPERF